jgi:hypothetical protein
MISTEQKILSHPSPAPGSQKIMASYVFVSREAGEEGAVEEICVPIELPASFKGRFY